MKKTICINVFIFLFISSFLNAVLPPKYLQELDVTEKEVTEEESSRALDELRDGSIIAIKSLKKGAYLFGDNSTPNKQKLAVTEKIRFARFLKYIDTTPLETQFVVKRNGKFIGLKSLYFEGKNLATNKKDYEIVFEKSDLYKDTGLNQRWTIESGSGIDQVYLKNAATGGYLGVVDPEEEVREEIEDKELLEKPLRIGELKKEASGEIKTGTKHGPNQTKNRAGLFKIVILN